MRTNESGHITVLTLGMVFVVLAVCGMTIDGTRAFLLRRSLQNAVDAASTGGAAEIDRRTYYRSGGSVVELRPARARWMAGRILSMRGITATPSIEADERFVAVILRTEMETGLLRIVGIPKITVGAEARARAFPQVVPVAK